MPTVSEIFSDVIDTTLVIDVYSRTIKIPSGVTNIGVESDDETTILNFKMPRYKSGIDLKGFVVRINYTNANGEGDVYTAKDVKADDEFITFSWEVGRFAVMYKGNVNFIVCAKKFASDGVTVDKEFNTTVATLPVLEGLETEQSVVESQPDAIASAAYEAILLALDSDLKGDPGYTPVKGTDYYTPEEREEFLNEVILGAKASYANSFTNEVSGEVIRVDDVSPIEHSPEVKVQSKNLCSMSAFDVMYPNGSITEYDAATHTITMLSDSPGSQGQYLSPVKNLIVGETYTMSFDIKGTPGKKVKCGWDKKNIIVTLTGEYVRHSSTIVASHNAEAIIFYNKATADGGLSAGEYMQFDNVQIELGDTATDYTPYADPSTVTLTRCGKNLLPLTTFTYTPSSSSATFTDGVLAVNGYIAATRISASGLVGKKLTMSCHTISRSGEKGGGVAIEFRDAANARISGVYHQNDLSPIFSFTVPEGTNTLVVFFYASGSAETSGTAKYTKIQLEVGDSVTNHELYKGETYTPNANGSVDISTVSPTMTLFTDKPGITIDCKYNIDSNTILDNVEIDVDDEMSDTSINPVQNKVAKEYVDNNTMPLGEFTVVAVGNLINPNRLTDGYRVSEDTGDLVANDTYAATHFIPIESGKAYSLSQTLRHAWYDENKVYISGANSAFVGNAPANACYIRISVWKQNQASLMFTQTPSVPQEYIPYSVEIPELKPPKNKFNKDDMLVDGAYIGVNIFDKAKTTDGAYASEIHGNLNTGYSNYFYSDFIKCKPNTTYSANKGSTRIVAYKSDYSYSGGAKGASYTTNDDAEYIRISHLVEHKDSLMIVEGSDVPDYYIPYQIIAPWLYTDDRSSLSDKTIVCFGDSITYNGYTGVITEETGIKAINVGMASARYAKTSSSSDAYKNLFALHNVIDAVCGTQQWSYFRDLESNGFTSQWNQIQKLSKIDFNTVDFVSFAYGTNDYASATQLVNTDDPYDINTVTGALRYSVKTLLAKYPHLKILVSLPIYRFFTDSSNNITSDGDTKDFGGGTLARYCEAIAKTATSMHIPYVDCYNGGGINEFNRLYYFDITDGTHPKKAGQDVIGHCIASWLKNPGVVQSYIGSSGVSTETLNQIESQLDEIIETQNSYIGGTE